jgi:hypothetical protein
MYYDGLLEPSHYAGYCVTAPAIGVWLYGASMTLAKCGSVDGIQQILLPLGADVQLINDGSGSCLYEASFFNFYGSTTCNASSANQRFNFNFMGLPSSNYLVSLGVGSAASPLACMAWDGKPGDAALGTDTNCARGSDYTTAPDWEFWKYTPDHKLINAHQGGTCLGLHNNGTFWIATEGYCSFNDPSQSWQMTMPHFPSTFFGIGHLPF